MDKNEKVDLTQYSDMELSMQVFNDETLYRMRRRVKDLVALLDEYFIYTNEQMKVLKQDLYSDLEDC